MRGNGSRSLIDRWFFAWALSQPTGCRSPGAACFQADTRRPANCPRAVPVADWQGRQRHVERRVRCAQPPCSPQSPVLLRELRGPGISSNCSSLFDVSIFFFLGTRWVDTTVREGKFFPPNLSLVEIHSFSGSFLLSYKYFAALVDKIFPLELEITTRDCCKVFQSRRHCGLFFTCNFVFFRGGGL